MADKSLAKALKRKMGLDEDILAKNQVITGGVSLLMNAPRRSVFEYVCNNPGSHLRAISRKLGISAQTAQWHLLKLTEGYLIASFSMGKKKLFLPRNGIIRRSECEILGLLRNNELLRTYRFIKKHPNVTQKAMSQALDFYQQKLSIILLSLEKSRLIVHEKRGREKVYRTTNVIKDLEESLQQKSPRLEKWILDVLTKDGVNPRIIETDNETMKIELNMGTQEVSILSITKNPLARLLKN